MVTPRSKRSPSTKGIMTGPMLDLSFAQIQALS